jgi:hypothetical protein
MWSAVFGASRRWVRASHCGSTPTRTATRRRCGHDEVVVGDRSFVEGDGLRLDVHTARLGQEHARVHLVSQHPADGSRDVSGRQTRRGDLIEERLEEVVIPAIEQRDVHRSALECLCGGQTCESATDDDDVGRVHASASTALTLARGA